MTGSPPQIPEHELLVMIGTGAYGAVWLARTVTGGWRAVKVVQRATFEHARTYEREYSALQRVEPLSRSHESLVDILQIGRNDDAAGGGYFYYVMELADAVPVAGRGLDAENATGRPIPGSEFWPGVPATYTPRTLANELAGGRRMTAAECARFGAEAASGLAYLHAHGLVHRDIKPANLLFVGGKLKLADIGLVARFEEARTFVGTGGYIPPEGPGLPQADIFALGKVLYEMATGLDRLAYPDLPAEFREIAVGALGADYGELNAIILRACSPEARDRHTSAAALRGELLLLQGGQSVRQLRQHERLARGWRRLALAASVLGLVGLASLTWQRRQTVAAKAFARRESQQRQALELRELTARQNLYAVDMNLAQVAIEAGNFGRAEALLAAYLPPANSAGLRGFEWFHYWQRARGDSVGVLPGHAELISGLALSPEGTRLYSSSSDNTLREWSLKDRRELRRWTLPEGRFMTLALDAAGGRIALEGGNPALSAWLDLDTGVWTTNRGTVSHSVAWTPDGRRLLRGTRSMLFETNATVELSDLAYRSVRELPEAGGRLAFSPDGTRFATGPWGDSVTLWSWPELTRVRRVAGVGLTQALAFSPDGRWFVATTRDGRLSLWDGALTGRAAERLTHGGGVIWGVAFSPDGTRLATVGNDQTVRTWSVPELKAQHVYRGHRSEVWAIDWSRDGRQLVSAGKDATIRLWDAHPAAPVRQLTNLIKAPRFSADDQLLAVCSRGDDAFVHETSTLSLLHRLGPVGEVGAFSTDNLSITLLTRDWVLEQRTLSDGRVSCSRKLQVPPGPVSKRLLAERWLAAGLVSGEIFLQSTTSNAAPSRLAGHSAGVSSLAVSPDGRWLLSGSIDRTARLWNLQTMTPAHVFTPHRMGVCEVAFTRDGTRMATGSWDDSVRLWSLADFAELALLDGHEGGVQSMALTPDGRSVAAISGSGILKFWSVAAQRETGHIPLGIGPHQGWLSASPSGRWIAAVDGAGVLTLLEAPPVKLPAP